MNISSMLDLNTVTVNTVTEISDGQGGLTSTTASVVLSKAAIWVAGSASLLLSDKVTRMSTHVLCYLPSEYNFISGASTITYAGLTYKTVGHGDDVMQKGEVGVIGLERMS